MIRSNDPPIAVGDPGFDNGERLHFGSSASPGVIWIGAVTAPASGAGEIAFTQLVDATIETLTDSEDTSVLDTNGYVLDTSVLYDGKTVIESSDTATITSNDSPNTSTAGRKAIYETANFETYLMYRPDGVDSIWVTLRMLSWGFFGSTEKDPDTGKWSVPNPADYYINNALDTTDLPVWDENVTDIQFVVQP